MKIFTLRNFAECCDCTPKQWISLCNTLLLLLVAFMCGVVIYETYDLDQRFVNILDSSVVTLDLAAMDLIESEISPYWREISDNIAVYSAFHDIASEQDPFLVIIGRMTHNWTLPEELRCLIKYPDDEVRLVNVSMQSTAKCNLLYLYCDTIKDVVPEKVAVISLQNTLPKQWLKVESRDSKREINSESDSVAICVKPLIHRSLMVKDVADFVAFYEAIGVKHFFFYNYNVLPEVVDFLRQLMDKGLDIELLSWKSENDAACNGNVVISETVQDCVHRSLGKHNEVFVVDVKDFVVPMQHLTLWDMLKHIRLISSNSSVLSIKYAEYCPEGRNYIFKSTVLEDMVMRGEISFPDFNYILQPKTVAGICDKENLIPPFVLSENDVLVQRHKTSCSESTLLDTTAHKFLQKFKDSVAFQNFYENNLNK